LTSLKSAAATSVTEGDPEVVRTTLIDVILALDGIVDKSKLR